MCIRDSGDPLRQVAGIAVRATVGDHGDAETGQARLKRGHPLHEIVGAHERPLDPDEGLFLIAARACTGQPAVAAVRPAALVVAEQHVDAAEREVTTEST